MDKVYCKPCLYCGDEYCQKQTSVSREWFSPGEKEWTRVKMSERNANNDCTLFLEK